MSECVLYEHRGPVGYLTINRPKALNALNEEVLLNLENAISLINEDKRIKVVILTGSGEKSFVAGADIAAMKDRRPGISPGWANGYFGPSRRPVPS